MSILNTSFLLLATALYGGLGICALLWAWWAGRPNLLWLPGTTVSMHLLSSGLGLALGLLVALATHLAARLAWLDRLNAWFASVLGPVSWLQAFLLALLSSVGEELFFRGAMQPSWGLWITTLVFGSMHLPPRLQLASWTLLALILGLAFGALMQQIGSISGPILAHFTINFFNLRLIGRKAEGLVAAELPGPEE